jgi:hypothetical protein
MPLYHKQHVPSCFLLSNEFGKWDYQYHFIKQVDPFIESILCNWVPDNQYVM